MIALEWLPREPPLPPTAVLARGAAARALVERLVALEDEKRQSLSGVAGPELVVIAGPDLPWVDGAVWLGTDPRAPALRLPTTREPSVHPALVERAVLAKVSSTPVVVLSDLLVPLGAMRPLTLEALRRWQEAP